MRKKYSIGFLILTIVTIFLLVFVIESVIKKRFLTWKLNYWKNIRI